MTIKSLSLQVGALIIALQSATAAHAATISCPAPAPIEKQKNEKLLKTFTAEFWKIVREHIHTYPQALRQEGIVVGDFHFENLGLYFDRNLNSPALTLNDLDDSGVNYLMGDLLKFLVYVRAVNNDVDLSAVFDAYVLGLQGQTAKTPAGLQELLKMKVSEFDKQKLKYNRNREEEYQTFQSANLSPSQRNTLEKLKTLPLFQNFSNIRAWVQVNDSGSSAGMERYLYLATSKLNGAETVIEFKALKCSATGAPQQQDLEANFQKVTGALSQIPQLSGTRAFLRQQTVLSLDGKAYLVREKLPNPIKDLEIEQMNFFILQAYAEYYASFLGLVHSGNSSETYRQALLLGKNQILEDLKPLYKELKHEVDRMD